MPRNVINAQPQAKLDGSGWKASADGTYYVPSNENLPPTALNFMPDTKSVTNVKGESSVYGNKNYSGAENCTESRSMFLYTPSPAPAQYLQKPQSFYSPAPPPVSKLGSSYIRAHTQDGAEVLLPSNTYFTIVEEDGSQTNSTELQFNGSKNPITLRSLPRPQPVPSINTPHVSHQAVNDGFQDELPSHPDTASRDGPSITEKSVSPVASTIIEPENIIKNDLLASLNLKPSITDTDTTPEEVVSPRRSQRNRYSRYNTTEENPPQLRKKYLFPPNNSKQKESTPVVKNKVDDRVSVNMTDKLYGSFSPIIGSKPTNTRSPTDISKFVNLKSSPLHTSPGVSGPQFAGNTSRITCSPVRHIISHECVNPVLTSILEDTSSATTPSRPSEALTSSATAVVNTATTLPIAPLPNLVSCIPVANKSTPSATTTPSASENIPSATITPAASGCIPSASGCIPSASGSIPSAATTPSGSITPAASGSIPSATTTPSASGSTPSATITPAASGSTASPATRKFNTNKRPVCSFLLTPKFKPLKPALGRFAGGTASGKPPSPVPASPRVSFFRKGTLLKK